MRTPLTLLLITSVCAATGGAEEFRDAATHDQLVNVYREASRDDPMRKLEEATGGDPSIVNQPEDLISQSDIISFNGLATLVPKRAIIGLPADMEERIRFVEGSQVVPWAEFYALNRGWITTVEVSRVQAEGNVSLGEEMTKRIQASRNLVVATLMAGPISVLPPKVEPETAATEP